MADPLSGLDNLAEVSDIVQRKKGLSTRMRNEAIRQGIQDPTNFQTEFAPQIQQAQQPTEFYGAGRKEISDQNYDLGLPNIFGAQTQSIGGQKFYYGDYDPSKVQYGLGDYKTQDIGQGKYNILGNDGNVLGTGYKSVLDTINEMAPGKYQTGLGGGLADWEVLGQVLSGGSPAARQSWGSLPINNQSEQISGANTLYGSQPVFYDGKLLGYKSNFGAAPGWEGSASGSGGQDQMKWNPFGYQATHSGKSHAWATGLGRQIDPNAYQGLVRSLGGYDYFAPLSNVEKLPGWTNVEAYQHQDKNYGGWGAGITKLADALGPLGEIGGDLSLKSTGENLDKGGLLYAINKGLATADPAGEAIAKGVADLFGVKGGSLGLVRTVGEPVGNLLGYLFAYGIPIGSLAMSADSASTGNEKGATDALGRAAVAYAMNQVAPAIADSGMGGAPVEVGTTTEGVAANSMAGSSGGVFDSGVSLGSTAANQAAQSYALNTAANYLQNGGNLDEALKAAAFSSVSGQAGNWLANATQGQLGDIASKALGGAASGGISSLFSKGSPVAGSLYGAMSGGLHGYLNTVGRGTEGGLTPEKNQQNRELAKNATTLAKLFAKR